MLSKITLTATAATLLIVSATAAVQAQMPGNRRMPGPNGVPEGYIRITATLNLFVAGPTGEGEEADKLRDRSRRFIYSTAARECDILRETLAQECALENVTSNLNVTPRYQPNQPEGYNVSGTMTLSVKLKKE